MKIDIEKANTLSLAQPRLPTTSTWPQIYEYVKIYPYKGLIDIELDEDVNFVVHCLNDDAIALQYLWTGGQLTEPLSLNVWKRLAKQSRATLDVGAYTGFYALTAASVSSSVVYAYEPVSFIFSRLAQNVMLNGFSNVNFVNKAVSDNVGTVEIGLRFGPKLFSSGSSIVNEMMRNAAYCQPIDTLTLDVAHQHEPIDLIKVDVEGAEEAVLKGALGLLAATKPVLLFETRINTYDICMAIVKDMGFNSIILEKFGGVQNSIIYHTSSYLYSEIELLKSQGIFD